MWVQVQCLKFLASRHTVLSPKNTLFPTEAYVTKADAFRVTKGLKNAARTARENFSTLLWFPKWVILLAQDLNSNSSTLFFLTACSTIIQLLCTYSLGPKRTNLQRENECWLWNTKFQGSLGRAWMGLCIFSTVIERSWGKCAAHALLSEKSGKPLLLWR